MQQERGVRPRNDKGTITEKYIQILNDEIILNDSQLSRTIETATPLSPTPSQQLRANIQNIEIPQTTVRTETIQPEPSNNAQLRTPEIRHTQPHVRPSIENRITPEPIHNRTRTGHEPSFQPILEYTVPYQPPQTLGQEVYIRTTPDPVPASMFLDLPPVRNIQNGTIPPEKYAIFQKTWKKERNYSGEPYDLLYDKARLFIDACRRLGITEDQYHAVFPCILEGRAEDYFIYNIGPDRTWSEIYRTMDTHFNTNTNHNQYWADWTTITFARMKEEHPDSPPHEVLDLMINKLQKAQRALGASYQGEI
ncbi:hypothetical protein RRF57_012947 [Xylaria bambusicola]|uniref:Uncharacterized protein n=1 Tax=Xylaria bambusicola TaxID=326684 RepID=A0AAN7Z4Y3_9PEZI